MTEADEERFAALETRVAELKAAYDEAMGLLARSAGQINTVARAVRDLQHRQNGHGLILP